MEISQKLPQFLDLKSLLIVTGKQEMEFYIAFGGKIERVESLQIIKPRYSDKESLFGEVVGGGIFKTGSGQVPLKEKMLRNFAFQFRRISKQIPSKNDYSSVYLFSPKYISEVATQELPFSLRKKIRFIFDGDYYNVHPFKLLEMIKGEVENKKIVIMSEEADKIIHKPRISAGSAKKRAVGK
ncbi:MAG: hypothetical protein PHW72_01845 [Candidatus Pacebacteria bacterium]|nr:hypothetical protein [Candidatus Paceibacterota bacterium]